MPGVHASSRGTAVSTNDPADAEADAQVAAARRAAWCQDHAAAMAAWWCLAGIEPGIEAAVNFAAIAGTGVDQLPRAVVGAITAAADASDRDTIRLGLEAIADRAQVVDRVGAEAAVISMTRTVTESLPDGARDRLAQRLVGGDVDFWLRCQRAAAMAALGRLRDDQEMVAAATELAVRECYERPALTLRVVFCVVGPIVHAHTGADGGIDRAALDAALVAELAALPGAMLDPDAIIGGTA